MVLLISDKRVVGRRGARRRRISSSNSEGGGCRREEQESKSGGSESDEDSSVFSDTGSDGGGSEEGSKGHQRREGSADEMENPIRVRKVVSCVYPFACCKNLVHMVKFRIVDIYANKVSRLGMSNNYNMGLTISTCIASTLTYVH